MNEKDVLDDVEDELEREVEITQEDITGKKEESISLPLALNLMNMIKNTGRKSRGVGFTRKNKNQSHKKIKQEKKSRKINKKIANKKSRPTGSKKRK